MATFPSFGINGMSQGVITNQALLLEDIRNGLAVYNTGIDPFISMFTEPTIRQVLRVSQAPKQFGRTGEGNNPIDQKSLFRELMTPLLDYDLSSEWTIQGIQDMLISDLATEVEAVYLGDMELVNALFFASLFTSRTAGSIGTPYQASFYNGETDVPPYKNNVFAGTPHYHYKGINATTFALSHLREMLQDVREHGYGRTPGSCYLVLHTNQAPDIMGMVNTNAANTILQAITAMRQKGIDQGVYNTGIVIEGVMISFTDDVPAGYVGLLTSTTKPVAQRQHIEESARGLQMFQSSFNEQYPLAGMKFLRRTGYAPQHLGACTFRQIVASTSYTNPTFRLGGLY